MTFVKYKLISSHNYFLKQSMQKILNKIFSSIILITLSLSLVSTQIDIVKADAEKIIDFQTQADSIIELSQNQYWGKICKNSINQIYTVDPIKLEPLTFSGSTVLFTKNKGQTEATYGSGSLIPDQLILDRYPDQLSTQNYYYFSDDSTLDITNMEAKSYFMIIHATTFTDTAISWTVTLQLDITNCDNNLKVQFERDGTLYDSPFNLGTFCLGQEFPTIYVVPTFTGSGNIFSSPENNEDVLRNFLSLDRRPTNLNEYQIDPTSPTVPYNFEIRTQESGSGYTYTIRTLARDELTGTDYNSTSTLTFYTDDCRPSTQPTGLRLKPNLDETFVPQGTEISSDHIQFIWNIDKNTRESRNGMFYLIGSKTENFADGETTEIQTCTIQSSYSICDDGTGKFTFIIDYNQYKDYKFWKVKYITTDRKLCKDEMCVASTSSGSVYTNKLDTNFILSSYNSTNYGVFMHFYGSGSLLYDENFKGINPIDSILDQSGTNYSNFQVGIWDRFETTTSNTTDNTTQKRGESLVYNRPDTKYPLNAPETTDTKDNITNQPVFITNPLSTDPGFHFFKLFLYGVTPSSTGDGYSAVTIAGSKTTTIRRDITSTTSKQVTVGDVWDCRDGKTDISGEDLGDSFVNIKDTREVLRHIIGTTCNDRTSIGSGTGSLLNLGNTKPDINDYEDLYNTSTLPVDTCQIGKRGDINNDGVVDGNDADTIMNAWAGFTPALTINCISDLNNDGLIDPNDAYLIYSIISNNSTGFLHNFNDVSPTCSNGKVRGDLDGNGQITLIDTQMILQVFYNQIPNTFDACVLDTNGDDQFNFIDVIQLDTITNNAGRLSYKLDSTYSEIRKRGNTAQGTKTRYDDPMDENDSESDESVNLFDALRILQYVRDEIEYIPIRNGQ